MESTESLIQENIGWLRGWLEARLSGHRRQDVDDICQDIFLKAIRGLHKLRDKEKFPAWLYRIANNKLKDYLRQQKRRMGREMSVDVDLADPRDAEAEIDRTEEAHRLLASVIDLPVRYREPMILRHVEDLSYDEISRILGISKSNVQVRIFRARQMLRQATELTQSSVETEKSPKKHGLGDLPASAEKIGIL
jgi:RNA polymerase sigma-70 factor (ECF subfamily)